jgi:hypothetical protein
MDGIDADVVPTLPSDIASFWHKHPLDKRAERKIADVGNGQYVVEIRGTFEIFRFSVPEYGEVVFDIRGIKDALADGKLQFRMYEMQLIAEMVEHVRNNNGVEVGRMRELTAADLERPGIMALWPDWHTTCIDGNNRMVRRWDDGLRTFRFALIVMDETIQPYVCRPGEEADTFLDRENEARGLQSIARMIVPHQ